MNLYAKLWPAFAISAVVIMSSASFCQSSGWARVEQISAGEQIKVVLNGGKSRRGEFQSANDSGLVIHSSGEDAAFSRENVQRILLKRKGHRGRNALIGAGLGAGVGLGTGAAVDKGGSFFPNLGKEILTPAFAIIGAGIGAALPSGGWTEIYRSR